MRPGDKQQGTLLCTTHMDCQFSFLLAGRGDEYFFFYRDHHFLPILSGKEFGFLEHFSGGHPSRRKLRLASSEEKAVFGLFEA